MICKQQTFISESSSDSEDENTQPESDSFGDFNDATNVNQNNSAPAESGSVVVKGILDLKAWLNLI